MKKLLFSILLLLLLLSYVVLRYVGVVKPNEDITGILTTNTYKYADPSYIDAVKSNGGIVEIPTAADTTITMLFGDDDSYYTSTSSCRGNTLTYNTYNQHKTVI